jgi:hypothetical protein
MQKAEHPATEQLPCGEVSRGLGGKAPGAQFMFYRTAVAMRSEIPQCVLCDESLVRADERVRRELDAGG